MDRADAVSAQNSYSDPTGVIVTAVMWEYARYEGMPPHPTRQGHRSLDQQFAV